jgi:hypothetical protein
MYAAVNLKKNAKKHGIEENDMELLLVIVAMVCGYYAGRRIKGNKIVIGKSYLVWCGCGCNEKIRKITVLSRESSMDFIVAFEDGKIGKRSCNEFMEFPLILTGEEKKYGL